MAWKVRTKECVGCGEPVTKASDPRRPWRCLNCSVSRNVRAMIEMHEKNGPAYDRWRAGMGHWMRREGLQGDPDQNP